MNCLSKLNTKTFVAAALLAGAGVTFASVGIAKGYNLSPLETYIIESFAQEQIEGFINSGATTLFGSPKIFYITPRVLARQVKTDLSGAQKKYLGNYGIVKSFVSKTNKDKTRVQFDIPKPDYTLDLHLAKNADPDLAKEVSPGERHGFYCQITSVGMSFTEFSYQLLQGYDYMYLYEHEGCRLQMGGTDQWGNITTGTELIRRKLGGEAFALTCPLITKADGGKFGKTESGNVWLDRRYTSPYKFYQFWLNVSDADAAKYIKIFTDLPKEEIDALIKEQEEAPHLRPLQKRLAKEVTVMVHSQEDYDAAVEASNILFGNSTSEALKHLDEQTLLDVFNGVPQFEVSREELSAGVKAIDLFTEKAAIFPSKGEMRKLVQSGGISVNKEKLTDQDMVIDCSSLLDEKYLLVQRGKKNYYLLIVK